MYRHRQLSIAHNPAGISKLSHKPPHNALEDLPVAFSFCLQSSCFCAWYFGGVRHEVVYCIDVGNEKHTRTNKSKELGELQFWQERYDTGIPVED